MLRRCRTSLLLLLALPLAAGADVVDLGVTGAMKYDSNVFGVSNNEVQSGIFSIGPTIGGHRDHSDFTYDLYYRPTYEVYTNRKASDLDGWDHFLRAAIGYSFSERTKIQGRDRFRNDANVNFQDPDAPPGAQTEVGRERYTENLANLDFTHFFDDRIYGTLNFFHTLHEYDDPRLFDDTTMGLSGSLVYTMNPKTSLGGGLGMRYQSVERRTDFPGSYTNFYNLFVIANHSFTPKLQLKFQGGPTLAQQQDQIYPDTTGLLTFPNSNPSDPTSSLWTDVSTCVGLGPVFDVTGCSARLLYRPDVNPPLDEFTDYARLGPVPGAEGGTDWTFFGDIDLLWEIDQNWRAQAGYVRQQSATSRNGTSVILDLVDARLEWRPAFKWTFALSALWNQRKSLGAVNFTRWLVADSGEAGDLDPSLPGVQPGDQSNYARTVGYVVQAVQSGVNIQQWYIALTSSRQINKNSIAHFTVSYLHQDTVSGRGSTADQVRAILRFNYNLDPIRW